MSFCMAPQYLNDLFGSSTGFESIAHCRISSEAPSSFTSKSSHSFLSFLGRILLGSGKSVSPIFIWPCVSGFLPFELEGSFGEIPSLRLVSSAFLSFTWPCAFGTSRTTFVIAEISVVTFAFLITRLCFCIWFGAFTALQQNDCNTVCRRDPSEFRVVFDN